MMNIRTNPFLSCADLRNKLDLSVSIESIRKYLLRGNFKRRKPQNDLDLTPQHKNARLFWAINYLEWCGWPHVIFSDESSFWLNDNGHEGWFNQGLSHPMSMDKHKGKVHVWAAISFLGKICIRVFTENNNAMVYRSFINLGFVNVANEVYGGPGTWVFQQDNSPIHTSQIMRNHFDSQGITVLDWPSKSPDLNPIENLWSFLKLRVRKRVPINIEMLTSYILEEWTSISDEYVQNLCASMPSRLDQCIKARGGLTKY
jgi:hypothetical protein